MSEAANPITDLLRQLAAAAAGAAIAAANDQLRARRVAELTPDQRETVSSAARAAVARSAAAANLDIDEINAVLGIPSPTPETETDGA